MLCKLLSGLRKASGFAGTIVVFALTLVFLGQPASAATLTWSNLGTDWGTASNWGSTAPGSADIALFNYGPTYAYQPNLSSGTAVGGLWDTGSGTLTIGGSALTINAATIGVNNTTGIEMDSWQGP